MWSRVRKAGRPECMDPVGESPPHLRCRSAARRGTTIDMLPSPEHATKNMKLPRTVNGPNHLSPVPVCRRAMTTFARPEVSGRSGGKCARTGCAPPGWGVAVVVASTGGGPVLEWADPHAELASTTETNAIAPASLRMGGVCLPFRQRTTDFIAARHQPWREAASTHGGLREVLVAPPRGGLLPQQVAQPSFSPMIGYGYRSFICQETGVPEVRPPARAVEKADLGTLLSVSGAVHCPRRAASTCEQCGCESDRNEQSASHSGSLAAARSSVKPGLFQG